MSGKNPVSFKNAVRALNHRNYRLFFGGQLVSLVGTWMQSLALSWLAYQLTHSALMLGAVGFCNQIGTFVLTPFAGVWVDRLDRRRILVVTQSLAMGQALILAALTLTGHVHIAHLFVLGGLLGLINAFDIPARQSFVPQMVEDRADLPSAIALNSSLVNSARLIGPMAAGALVAWVGVGICFLLNGLSYLAVIAALLAIRVPPREVSARPRHPITELKAGFGYLAGHLPILALLALLALVGLMGQPYTVLLPVFATQVLHGGPSTLGMLTGSVGVGALVGASILATRTSLIGMERVVPFASVIFSSGLLAFSCSRSLPVAMPLLAIVGAGVTLQMGLTNTLVQTLVDEEMRGRVMSFYTMAFMGMSPLGSLLTGFLAGHFGAPVAAATSGVAVLLGGLAYASRLGVLTEAARPFYVRKGLLPDDPGANRAASLKNG